VLVSPQGRVALIRRRRGGQEYWSFPGGGIKRGERPHQAARREVLEELGLDVRPERLLAVASGHVLYLAAIDSEPALRMRGPEVARRSWRDRYQPAWVPLDQLGDLDLRPRTAHVALGPLTRGTQPAAAAPIGPDAGQDAGLDTGLHDDAPTSLDPAGGASAAPAPRRRALVRRWWARARRRRPRASA